MMPFKNVVLGVSGGVDSAVAGLLLKKKGFNVIGVFMKNWDVTEEQGTCTTAEDLEDAKHVCKQLNIPFHEVNFVKEYWNDIFVTFINDYENGLTPNPDILCNKFIKFKSFFNHAIQILKADAIATGHYARSSFGDFLENYRPGVNAKLLKAKDHLKDQTFFLSQVPQKSLRRTMFPLASFNKDVVRKIATENGLEKVSKKPDSTGICFIGGRKFQHFISEYVSPKPGRFINIINGKVEGEHEGIHLFTLGQKCRIKGRNQAFYITEKNPETSDVFVAPGVNHSAHFRTIFITEKPHWIAEPLDLSYIESVDFRFQHVRSLLLCNLFELKTGKLLGVLKKPLRALTPGQYAVFYKDDCCLGSSRIIEIGPSEYALGREIPNNYQEY